MASARKWSQVAVAMQSALGASLTINSLTKAVGGVVTTSSPHGLSNGDFVVLAVQGMWQVNDRVFRVSSASGSVFTLEGEDTTNYDTFSSGTAQKITFGTSVTSATTLTSSGGNFAMIDTTTIHMNQKSQIPGLPDAATFDMDNIWDVSDAGLIAMKAAYDAQAKRAFKFTFGTGGQIMVFTGYVGANLLPGGSAQQLVTTKAVITMSGSPTYFAS
jgi:hypothetical protein